MKTKKKTKIVIAEQFALPGVAGAPPPPAAVVERVGTLGELVARLPGVECALKLGEKTVVVAGRRLTPGEERRVFSLVNECFPPVIPGVPGPDGKPGEERYAVTDPGYLKRKAEQYSLARALALWWGYPMFREQRAAAGVVGALRCNIRRMSSWACCLPMAAAVTTQVGPVRSTARPTTNCRASCWWTMAVTLEPIQPGQTPVE